MNEIDRTFIQTSTNTLDGESEPVNEDIMIEPYQIRRIQ